MAFELLYTRCFHTFTDFPDEFAQIIKFAAAYGDDAQVDVSLLPPFNKANSYDSKLDFVSNDKKSKYLVDAKITVVTGNGGKHNSSVSRDVSWSPHVQIKTHTKKVDGSVVYALGWSFITVTFDKDEVSKNVTAARQAWWPVQRRSGIGEYKILHDINVANKDTSHTTLFRFISSILQTVVFINTRIYIMGNANEDELLQDTPEEMMYMMYDYDLLCAAAIYLDVMSRGERWYDRVLELEANPMREDAINSALEKVYREQIHYSWLANALRVVYFIRHTLPRRKEVKLHAPRSLLNVAMRFVFECEPNILTAELHAVLFGLKRVEPPTNGLVAVLSRDAIADLIASDEATAAAPAAAPAAAGDVAGAITLPTDLEADVSYSSKSSKESFGEIDESTYSGVQSYNNFKEKKSQYETKYSEYDAAVTKLKAAAAAYVAIKAEVTKYNNNAKLVARMRSAYDNIEFVEWPDMVLALQKYLDSKRDDAEDDDKWNWPQGGSDELVLRAVKTLEILSGSSKAADNVKALFLQSTFEEDDDSMVLDMLAFQRIRLLNVVFGISADADYAQKWAAVTKMTTSTTHPMLPLTRSILHGGERWWEESDKYVKTAKLQRPNGSVLKVLAIHFGKFYSPQEAVNACMKLETDARCKAALKSVRAHFSDSYPTASPAMEGKILLECLSPSERAYAHSLLEPYILADVVADAANYWSRGATFPLFRALAAAIGKYNIAVVDVVDVRSFTLCIGAEYWKCKNFFGKDAHVTHVPVAATSMLERYTHRVLEAQSAHELQRGLRYNILTSVGDADVDAAVEEFLSTHVIVHERQRGDLIGLLLRSDNPLRYNCLTWWWLLQDNDERASATVGNLVVAGMLSFKIAVLKFRSSLNDKDAVNARVAAFGGGGCVSQQKLKLLGIDMPIPASNAYAQTPLHCDEEEDLQLLLTCVLKAQPLVTRKRSSEDGDVVELKRKRIY